MTMDEVCRREAERILAAKGEMASARDSASDDDDDDITRQDPERAEGPQPITEEEKQKLIQGIGFEQHSAKEDKTATPTKSESKNSESTAKGKATSSSSRSAATPTGVRRAIATRELGRKHSAESDNHQRDLLGELNASRDKDKDMMMDEDMAGATTEARTATTPPQGGAEFWAKNYKLDAKVDQLCKNVAVALNAVESRLGERIIGEEERRHREVLATNHRADEAPRGHRVEGQQQG